MGLFKDAMRKGIPGRDAGASMGGTMPEAPRPTLVQGGPAYFTPEGYRPPMQPQQAFMPTDTMGDPIGDMFRRQLPPVRGPSLPRLPPQKDPRDDQIFVPPPIDDPRMEPMPEPPADPRDYMPMPVIDPGLIANPAPTPPDGGSFGNLGGSGYGRFPLGSAGPEYLYDDDNNPIMEPKFNTTIPDGGFPDVGFPDVGGGLPMPPMAPPMMPPSFERMDEPRDEFIPRMPNENPVPFIPPVEMPRDIPPMMPPSFERIEEDPRMPLEEPIAMPRNPEMVADIQRRMAPPAQPVTEPMPFLQEPEAPRTGGIPSNNDRNINDPRGPINTVLPEPPMDIAPPMAPPRRSIAPPSFEREPREVPREVPREAPIQAPLPPAQIEQIKQVLPQLPQEQLMEILPQLPPEAIQELPEELIRKIMPMMPEPMMPEPMMPRMQMPGPIATPTPRSKRPSLPMMPMMGGRGRL